MDIEFTCNKCGQHILIGEAGAGQAVNCPKCGQPLTVPQTQPGPSRPMTPAHIPPVISKPITQKRKRPTGLIVGLGAAALLILLFVLGHISTPDDSPSKDSSSNESLPASAPSENETTASTPIIIHGVGHTPPFTPSPQVDKYAKERESIIGHGDNITNPHYVRGIQAFKNDHTIFGMDGINAMVGEKQAEQQEEADRFIGISEEELIRRLGQPVVITIAETIEGEPFKMLCYDNSRSVTFFTIFEKEGTVSSGYYRGCSFERRN